MTMKATTPLFMQSWSAIFGFCYGAFLAMSPQIWLFYCMDSWRERERLILIRHCLLYVPVDLSVLTASLRIIRQPNYIYRENVPTWPIHPSTPRLPPSTQPPCCWTVALKNSSSLVSQSHCKCFCVNTTPLIFLCTKWDPENEGKYVLWVDLNPFHQKPLGRI